MAAKMSVLGLILSSYPYLTSAMVRFPFDETHDKVYITRSQNMRPMLKKSFYKKIRLLRVNETVEKKLLDQKVPSGVLA